MNWIVRVYTWAFLLLMLVIASDVYAQTTEPATTGLRFSIDGGPKHKTATAAATEWCAANYPNWGGMFVGGWGTPEPNTSEIYGPGGVSFACYLAPSSMSWKVINAANTLVCPDGYTLEGDLCRAPVACPMYGTPEGDTAPSDPPAGCTCPAGHVWVSKNGCRKQCDAYRSGAFQIGSDAWGASKLLFPKGQTEMCHSGCIVQQKSGEFYAYDDGTVLAGASETGWACQTSSEPPKPPATKPPAEPKEPPCSPTEGVLTSSSGTVSCIPQGTPAPRKPEVEEKKKKETFPDGSVKETNTKKTTDPKTGASHTHTTTSSTGGMAGPAGTGTSTENDGKPTDAGDGSGDGDGDGDGDCEGSECAPGEFPGTDGLYEKKYEGGIQGVLNQRFSEIRDTPLFQLGNTLVPTSVPNSGACTPFSFSMNIGPGMNFGTSSIQVPCYVWSFIRIVMLISAFLLARRLIFGG